MNHLSTKATVLFSVILSSVTYAQDEVADMSDPLAVYSQIGSGITDRGINIKYGQAYDTGNEQTAALNILEVKGIFGGAIGWSDTVEPDNSIDSVRFRNFQVNVPALRATQFDANYDVQREELDVSYSLVQALPTLGPLSFYPWLGGGVAIQNNAVDSIDNGTIVVDPGFSIPGVYGVAGMFVQWTISEKVWMNYNPTYLTSLAGSEYYLDNAYGIGNSDILLHELVLSYQLSSRSNLRYFANFSDEVSYTDGEHKIEFNYQF